MKIEVRCGGCGKGYLVDESKLPADGGFVPCQTCGATIELKAPPAPPPRTSAPGDAAASSARAREVCCPRCNFHFAPDVTYAPKRGGRPTLLIVEDMEYFIEIARDALVERYEVKTARTLDEARAILVRGGIDLLLLDLTLEKGENGLRLLNEPPGKICPVLLFTAQDEADMYGDRWAQLKAMGVDDVVLKGMNMGEMLLRKVTEMLGETSHESAFRR